MPNENQLESRDPILEPGQSAGVHRRRLIRAGLSAAPVLLALKSPSVLATTQHQCIRSSAFSSLRAAPNMILSHVHNPNGFTCYSHGYWKNHAHPYPYTDKDKSYFLTQSPLQLGYQSAGFVGNFGSAYTTMTLQQVLNMTGNNNHTALARHLVGTFLTAVAYTDANSILTQWQCQQIWTNAGVWSPIVGQTWAKADWMSYFNYVYGSNDPLI